MRFAAALVVLVGCATGAGSKAGDPVAPVAADPLAIPERVWTALDHLSERLNREMKAGRCPALTELFEPGQGGDRTHFDAWCKDSVAAGINELVIEREPYFMKGDSVLLRLSIAAITPARTESLGAGPALLRIAGEEVTNIDWRGDHWADLLPGQITAETVALALDPGGAVLDADVTSHVRSDSAAFFAFRIRVGGGHEWGIRSVTQLGAGNEEAQPCRFREVGGSMLLVVPPRPGPDVAIRLLYSGLVPASGPLDHIRKDEIILRPEAAWLPTIAGAGTPAHQIAYDVTVNHPVAFTMFGQGKRVPPRRLGGGHASTKFHHLGDGFTLYGFRGHQIIRNQLRGTEVELAGPDGSTVADLQQLVERAFAALAAFGPYPHAELRVSVSDIGGGEPGYAALSNVTLARANTRDVGFLTRALARGWFPGVVPAAASDGSWHEGLTQYLATWALPPKPRKAERAAWLAAGDRPPALLAELEDRVGRPAVEKALAQLLHTRKGKPTGWTDVLAVLEGSLGAAPVAQLRSGLAQPKKGTARGPATNTALATTAPAPSELTTAAARASGQSSKASPTVPSRLNIVPGTPASKVKAP